MISCRARLVTMDETWLYHYDLETNQQSMEWRHSGSPRPKNSECKTLAGKVLASFSGDQDGILRIDYLPKGPSYQRGILLISAGAIEGHFEGKTPRGGKVTKGVVFLHDNAPAHRALATQKKLAYLGFQCLDHLPYSPNLAPSDYTCSLE